MRHSTGSFDQHLNPNAKEGEARGYPAFDWLRIALAAMVATSHLGVILPEPFGGRFAVEVFLALSGWLIGGILIRSRQEDLPRFFYNRIVRIWFPYILAIVVLYGIALFREGVSANWLKYLFYDATFTHYNFVTFPRAQTEMPLGGSGNQFWSLAVEEQFYLIAPIIIIFMPSGKSLFVWIAIVIIAIACQSIATPISIGITCVILQRDIGEWHLSKWGRPAVIAVTILLVLASHYYNLSQLRSLCAGGIVLSLAFPGRRNPLGLFLGGISYPFYLNHWIGGFVAHAVGKRVILMPPLYVAFGLTVSFAAATAAWMIVDRVVLARRKHWYSPNHGKLATIAAYSTVGIGLVGGMVIAGLGG